MTRKSLKSGDATAAAAAGIPDRIVKKHGRFKYEKANDDYIKGRLFKKLSVS